MRLRLPVILTLTLAAVSVQAESMKDVATVVDGGPTQLHGSRIRLVGIDSPESKQECQRNDGTAWSCGQTAALASSDHIGRAVVACRPSGKDRYERSIATCFLSAEDLHRWMVARGWTVAYRQYSHVYVEGEDRAHAEGVGIWSGSFVMPADWRASHR